MILNNLREGSEHFGLELMKIDIQLLCAVLSCIKWHSTWWGWESWGRVMELGWILYFDLDIILDIVNILALMVKHVAEESWIGMGIRFPYIYIIPKDLVPKATKWNNYGAQLQARYTGLYFQSWPPAQPNDTALYLWWRNPSRVWWHILYLNVLIILSLAIKQLTTLTVDLRKLPKDAFYKRMGPKGEYYGVSYQVGITFGAGGIEFRFLYKGTAVGSVNTDYC